MQMRNLDGHANQFTGTLPASWSTMTQLAALNLDPNNITGPLPMSWSKMIQASACHVSLKDHFVIAAHVTASCVLMLADIQGPAGYLKLDTQL